MMSTPFVELLTKELAWQIQIQGLVQGVGFRPAVWALAQRYHLRGRVLNTGQGVQIMAVGGKADLANFLSELINHPPPLAKISNVNWEPISTDEIPEHEFLIAATEHTGRETGIVPDAATCSECLKEIFDPFARRYRYPFTNCTHCGPRLTIQKQIPYDRSHTTMTMVLPKPWRVSSLSMPKATINGIFPGEKVCAGPIISKPVARLS